MMKAKVKRGSGVRGALNYALDEGHKATGLKLSEIVGGNVAGNTARSITQEFGAVIKSRPDCKNPLWHCSLTLPPNDDQLSSEKWNELAFNHLKNMDLDPDNRPWVAVRHSDTEMDHIHIYTIRIDFDANIWHGKWEVRRAIESTQLLEKKFDLTLTPGLDQTNENGEPILDENGRKVRRKKDKKGLSSNEIQMSDRTGQPSPRTVLQNLVDEALSNSINQSIFSFIERIESAGGKAIPNVASTGKMNGFAFEYAGIKFKASDLGKSYTWAKLQSRGVNYEQDQDGTALIGAAQRIRAGINQVSSTKSERSGDISSKFGTEHGTTSAEFEQHDPEYDGKSDESGGRIDTSNPEIEESDGIQLKKSREITDEPESNGGSSEQKRKINRVELSKDAINSVTDVLDRRNNNWSDTASNLADLTAPLDPSTGKNQSGVRVLDDLKPDHRSKVEAWREQHAALKSPHYRVTCMSGIGNGKLWNMGELTGGGEILYTAAQIEDLIPKLRRRNAQGDDIYLTPIDPVHHYLVVDDINVVNKEILEKSPLKPCLVQLSSENSWQAIIKTDRFERNDEQSIANEVVRNLNKKLGDPKVTGVIHPFRMAGFANKKPSRNNIFTRVITAIHCICDYANSLLDKIRESIDSENARLKAASEDENTKRLANVESTKRLKSIESQGGSVSNEVDVFKKSWKKHADLEREKGAAIDSSVIDFCACQYMIQRGFSVDAVKQALIAASPSVTVGHESMNAYADRTLLAVQNRLKSKEAARSDDLARMLHQPTT
jgi:hypothetical protein